MNDREDMHVPTPEFRELLEREVMLAYRRETQFASPPSMARRSRIRTAATLAIGLALGVGGAVATAQVQNAQQRDSLLQISEMNYRLAALRLEIAYAEAESTYKAVRVGVKSRVDGFLARNNSAIAEAELERIKLETEEIRATGRPVRNELWAPLVGKEDFVSQRLRVDRDLASWQSQQGLKGAAEEAALRARVGLTTASDSLQALRALNNAKAEVMFIWDQQQLRDQFLVNKLTEQQVVQRLRILELKRSLEKLADDVKEASERAKRTKELQAVGMASLLDVKKAEVDSMQAALELERARQLQAQLKSAIENKSPSRAKKDS